jgi:hypothetical protein
MRQKVILKSLGNRLPMKEEELIEYIIDNIPDRVLRNQARVGGLKTRTSLITSFKRVKLWDKRHTDIKNGEEKFQFQPKNRNNEGGKSKQRNRNYFNCDISDHLSRDCSTKTEGSKFQVR